MKAIFNDAKLAGMSSLGSSRTAGVALASLFVLALAGCKDKPAPAPSSGSGSSAAPAPATELTVYSGRSEKLVGPILQAFEREHGIKLKVRYGETAALATLLLEEGKQSPAAVFLAQDVGAVGALTERGLLAPLPDDVVARVPEKYRAANKTWVGVTGRVRTIVYAPARVAESELPGSVLELTQPKWKGRVGWAPQNASFQVFVTGVRKLLGEDAATKWLAEMKANGTRDYAKNGAIVQAVAAGEIDLGLVNHYYLYQFLKDDPAFAAKNHFTVARDAGSLVNLSAVGVLASADPAAARAGAELARYLLADATQAAFARETHEYPVVAGVESPAGLRPLAELEPPPLDLSGLGDLEGTLAMLKKTGVTP
ncbi:MAG: iron ABC transporter substrate-binding protein [Kofleriaceae bacterium]